MSNIAPLLDRNQAFARTGVRQNMPAAFLPRLHLYVVTCIDCRVDPAQTLQIKLGEALVQRNIGGRVTAAVIWFEVAIIHHTDCGSTLLADDDLRHAQSSSCISAAAPVPPGRTGSA